MSLDTFRTKIRAYLRTVNVAQTALARELGLHPSVLSHKLNGKGIYTLSQPEVKKIVKFLAQFDAISTRSEAIELLEAMDLKATTFTPQEWQAAPLNKLEIESEVAEAKVEQVAAKAVAGQLVFSAHGATPTPTASLPQPPLPTPELADNPPPLHNFPAQPTPLIGREHETTEARNILRRADIRMLTLVGAGGIGKTRLAYQIARDLLPDFQNGAWLVSLAPVSDPNLVVTVIAATLGVKVTPGAAPAYSLLDTLKNHLRDRQLLLLLDNFEQIAAAAPLLSELLAAAPRLKLLVTSRVILKVYGEHKFEVPPLSLPDTTAGTNGADLPPLDILSRYDAIALFVQRARAVNTNFSLTSANAPAIVEICTRLDGLPLAIELAAAWLRILTPNELLARLLDKSKQVTRIKLLTGGATNLPAHKQTLYHTLEWSYQFLETEAERSLFRRMGIFVGGGTWEAIQAICFEAEDEAEGAEEISLEGLNTLTALLDKSMVRRLELTNSADNSVETRFIMLEMVREYALEKLTNSQEIDLLRHRQAEYFVKFAETAQPELRKANQGLWRVWLEREQPNMRLVLRWLLDSPVEYVWATELAMRLGNALTKFWFRNNYSTEGSKWLVEITTRLTLNVSVMDQTSPAFYKQKITMFKNTGWLLCFVNQSEKARALLNQSCEMARDFGDKSLLALCLETYGTVLTQLNQPAQVKDLLKESLQLYEELDDEVGAAEACYSLGVIALVQADYSPAVYYFERSLKQAQNTDDAYWITGLFTSLGAARLGLRDYGQAEANYKEGLILCRKTHNQAYILLNLYGLAGVAGAARESVQRLQRSARLFGAAQTFGEAMNLQLPLVLKKVVQSQLATAQSQLDPNLWQQAWNEGRVLTPNQIIAFALE